jgi:hypothetical protein
MRKLRLAAKDAEPARKGKYNDEGFGVGRSAM